MPSAPLRRHAPPNTTSQTFAPSPRDPREHLARAQRFLRANDRSGARHAYRQALERAWNRDLAACFLSHVRLAQLSGDTPRAVQEHLESAWGLRGYLSEHLRLRDGVGSYFRAVGLQLAGMYAQEVGSRHKETEVRRALESMGLEERGGKEDAQHEMRTAAAVATAKTAAEAAATGAAAAAAAAAEAAAAAAAPPPPPAPAPAPAPAATTAAVAATVVAAAPTAAVAAVAAPTTAVVTPAIVVAAAPTAAVAAVAAPIAVVAPAAAAAAAAAAADSLSTVPAAAAAPATASTEERGREGGGRGAGGGGRGERNVRRGGRGRGREGGVAQTCQPGRGAGRQGRELSRRGGVVVNRRDGSREALKGRIAVSCGECGQAMESGCVGEGERGGAFCEDCTSTFDKALAEGPRDDGTPCSGCTDKTQPVTIEPDGKWYCAACVEEFYEDMEAERGRQEGRGGGGSGDQAMKEGAAEQTSRREGGDKGRQQEQTENPSSKADATASGW